MEAQGLPLDRISSFPPNIIHTILTRMPLRDAFRTSILSHNWRYHCRNIPKLRFDVFQDPRHQTLAAKLFHVIFSILLLHQGPILAFSLALPLTSCWEIDQIILHLSRDATLKEFTLRFQTGEAHKLLSAFFKLQELTVLNLFNCVFRPPVTFTGFTKLVKFSFHYVIITAEVFLTLISNCPLLKDFSLIGNEKHLLGCWDSNFLELFEYLPLLTHMCMSWYPIKCFCTGFIPQKLPTSLVHLKRLDLRGQRFGIEDDLLSTLSLVTSCDVEIIEMEMENQPTVAMSQAAMNLIDQQDYSYVILDHLRVIKITNFSHMKTGMDFVKLILAKSPMLKKVDIHIHQQVDIHGELKIVKELIQYPRASAKAEIIINKEQPLCPKADPWVTHMQVPPKVTHMQTWVIGQSQNAVRRA
ncbi:putative F-box domain, FBD domain, leucine-rich repeat domain superfamily [Helianthus anomalus]